MGNFEVFKNFTNVQDSIAIKFFEEICIVLCVNRIINLNILGAVVDIIGIEFQGATDHR